jgi:predicted dehydrogenase
MVDLQELKIGIIGTDTSHAIIFTRLLNDVSEPYHVSGGRVVAAYPGGSLDFPLSADRVEGFMNRLQNEYGVQRASSIEEVADCCDAILLLSADGRVHLEQFRLICSYGKPVFIDKPFALNSADGAEIFRLAGEQGLPIMSSSSLRYAEQLVKGLAQVQRSDIQSATVSGPLAIEPTQSHYFWYGIHSIEMLYTIAGPGCKELSVTVTETEEIIQAVWQDGRIGAVHCKYDTATPFAAAIRIATEIADIQITADAKPYYASLLEQITVLFRTGRAPLDGAETLEIIRFIEAAEQSRLIGDGAVVRL